MNTLIVYYSYTNNNEALANVIRQKLKCDILRIEEVKKRNGFTIVLDMLFNRTPWIKPCSSDIAIYDQYIFIAPIWAGKIASPMRSFLIRERFNISNYSFITLCGGQPGQKEKLVTGLTRLLGHEPGIVQELHVNDLIPDDKRSTVKYTTGYHVQPSDMEKFNAAIDDFINSVGALYELKRMTG